MLIINGDVLLSMTHMKFIRNILNQNTFVINVTYYLILENTQLWPIVICKALATALGGYERLASTPCHKLFNLLTGSNSLFFNVKEDPTKNTRILRYISDC